MHRYVGSNGRRPWAALILSLALLPAAASAQDAGFGTDIPLSLAVKQIVPDGYKVQIAPGVDSSVPVSWKEGGGWKQAITSAAKGAGYTAVVGADTVRITRSGAKVEVAEAPAAVEAAPKAAARREAVERARRPERVVERPHRERRVVRERRVAEVVEAETVSGGGFVMIPPRVARETVVVDAKGRPHERATKVSVAQRAEWIVREGENLQSVLRDWSSREGWKLVWESEFKYQIASAAKFDGDFVQATSELVRSMAHIRPLVTVVFYQGNKTVVVGNGSTDAAGGSL